MSADARKRRLGRGLSALISDPSTPKATDTDASRTTLAVAEIVPNPWQPRVDFRPDELAELASSIRAKGILSPLLVRPKGKGYELVAGERRLRAAKQIGLDRVPVEIHDLDDREMLEVALVENLQRDNLSPLEEARGYQRLAAEFDLTQAEIAERVGKSRPAVTNALRLLELPEPVLDEVRSGRLSAGHARALLALPTAAGQAALAREAVRRGWSVRELEKKIRLGHLPSAGGKKRPSKRDVHVADLERELERTLGTRVRIAPKKRGGSLTIQYASADELERLLGLLRSRRPL